MQNTDLVTAANDTRLDGPFVAVRLDGINFSSMVRLSGFARPFDPRFSTAMIDATRKLVTGIGAPVVLAYTQSDEVTLILDLGRSRWFDGREAKVLTACASAMASEFLRSLTSADEPIAPATTIMFDARVIDTITPDQTTDLFAWRLADAQINSTTSHARSVLGHSALQGTSTRTMRALCAEAGRPWGELDTHTKFGSFVIREAIQRNGVTRHEWRVHSAAPGASVTVRPDGTSIVVLSALSSESVR